MQSTPFSVRLDAERRHLEALAARADRGTVVSSAAMAQWVDSWDTAEELPPPEPDILPSP